MSGVQASKSMAIMGGFLIAWGVAFAYLFAEGSAECDPTNGCTRYHSPFWLAFAVPFLVGGVLFAILGARGLQRKGRAENPLRE